MAREMDSSDESSTQTGMKSLPDITGSITAEKSGNSTEDPAKTSATLLAEWRKEPENTSVKGVLRDRMNYSESLQIAAAIIDQFPNGKRDASSGYIGAIAKVLTDYPRQVATICADPGRGIASKTKFLPSVAEIVAWCEEKTEPLYRHSEREQRIADQLRERYHAAKPRSERPGLSKRWARNDHTPGRRANVHVLKEAPQYARMVELSKILPIEDWRMDERGIWISLYHFEGGAGALAEQQRLTEAFPPAAPRDSDRDFKASPHLVNSLKKRDNLDALNRRLDAAAHWSK